MGNISPTTDVVTEYTVPTPGGVTQGITAGSDGNLWFTEPGTAQVGTGYSFGGRHRVRHTHEVESTVGESPQAPTATSGSPSRGQ